MNTATLFDTEQYSIVPDDWDQDSWETPPDIARKMAGLITPSDRMVLEPAAGRGAIVRWIPRYCNCNITAFEIKESRVEDGKRFGPLAAWYCTNFLPYPLRPVFDVVITNPPFSMALEFIEKSLECLNPDNLNARLIYLLPGDYFCAQERNDRFEAMDCHIAHRYRIRGRVGYLKEAVQFDQRRIYDAVYVIKPGKDGATETVL